MKKYREKPKYIEASRWFKNGDHPIVEPYKSEETDGTGKCNLCGCVMNEHGWIDTSREGLGTAGRKVCPGDWIIKDDRGRYYPSDVEWFETLYEEV